MLDDNTMISVINRDNGRVGYTIPDMNNLHRNFESGERKMLTMEELRKLVWIPGGQRMLENLLMIENEEARQELLPSIEPEYLYTEEDVKTLLNNGSLDQLKDCLDFAPQGVINLVKQVAVEEKLNDIQKRDAILEATKFNVTKAIEINRESAQEENAAAAHSGRRATPLKKSNEDVQPQEQAGARRTAPKYNIVGKK